MNESKMGNYVIFSGNLTKGQNHELNNLIDYASRTGNSDLAAELEAARQSIANGKTKYSDFLPLIEVAMDTRDLKQESQKPSWWTKLRELF